MVMPDFSFLQNQQGTSAFGSLAQGLAQGAQLGLQFKNMQLQQAAQQQAMENAKNQYGLEVTKLNMDMNKADLAAKRTEYLQKALYNVTTAPVQTEGLTAPGQEPARQALPPYDAAMKAADLYRSLGMADEARKSTQDAMDILKDGSTYKPGQLVDIKTAVPDPVTGVMTEGGKQLQFVSKDYRSTDPSVPAGFTQVGKEYNKASLVNMNIGAKETDKESAKYAFDSLKQADTARPGIQSGLESIINSEEALVNMPTGPLTTLTAPMRTALAQAIGMDAKEMSKYQTAESAQIDNTLSVVKELGFNPSNTDREFASKKYGSNQLPEGRRAIARWMSSAKMRLLDKLDAQQAYFDAHGRSLTPEGTKSFGGAFGDWYKENADGKIKAVIAYNPSQMLKMESNLRAYPTQENIDIFKNKFGYTPWFVDKRFNK